MVRPPSSESGSASDSSTKKRLRDDEIFKLSRPVGPDGDLRKNLIQMKEKKREMKKKERQDAEKIVKLEEKLKQLETEKRDDTGDNTEDKTRMTNVQEETYKKFSKNKGDTLIVIQLENHYPDEEGGRRYRPQWVIKDLKDWHPKYTSLNLS